MRSCRAAVLLALGVSSGLIAESAPDPDLPQPVDLNLAASLIERPPFTRALDLSEKLQLTGIAYVDGKPVATLLDRETKKNYLVSSEPNAQGWKLAEASASTALKQSSVKIQVGNETVTIQYGEAQIKPTSSSAGGRIGPSVWPSEQEVIRHDENGRPYIRSSAYLSDADRDRYYRGWSNGTQEKYRNHFRDNREAMFKMSPQQRAEYSKKVFDQMDAEEKAQGGSRSDSGGPSFRGGPDSGRSYYRGPSSGGYSPGGSPYRGGSDSGGPSFRGGGPGGPGGPPR